MKIITAILLHPHWGHTVFAVIFVTTLLVTLIAPAAIPKTAPSLLPLPVTLALGSTLFIILAVLSWRLRVTDGPVGPDREIVLVHRDASTNSIVASRIPRSISSPTNQFPTAFSLHEKRFVAQPFDRPFQVTLWNHLRRSSDPLRMILGFEFYFIRGNDDVVLNSPFCQSASTNLRFVCENDGTLEVHVRLISESSGVESDFCQAYGSLYFSDGEDVAIAMLNWHPIDKYEFPILTDSVSAVEW